MAANSVWTAASSVSNGTGSWPQEGMLSSNTESFKPVSKWRILRSVFNCTRIWRDVGRQAQNLRVLYTLDLQFRSSEVNQYSATSKSRLAKDPTHPTNMLLSQFRESLDTKQSEKLRHGCKRSCISQDILFFGQVYKPCNMFPLVFSPQQPILEAVVVVAVVFLSLGDTYPTDHVDWGGWGTFYLLGTSLEPKNTCVSIVTLFQAASLLLFQAAYFWLKFREALALSFDRKRQHSEFLQGEGDVHQSLKGTYASKSQGLQDGDKSGVYLKAVKNKSGTTTHYKYEPRFKPPRTKLGSGSTLQLDRLSLGTYNTPVEAKIVRQFAAFYYGQDEGKVELEDGSHFSIPPMNPKEQRLCGVEKRKWVTQKAKELFQHLPKDAKWKHSRRATSIDARFESGNDGGDFIPSRTAQDTPPSVLLPEIQNDTPSTDDCGKIAERLWQDCSDMVEYPSGVTSNRQEEQLEFVAVQNVSLQYELTKARDHIWELQQEVDRLRSELQLVATSQVSMFWNHA